MTDSVHPRMFQEVITEKNYVCTLNNASLQKAKRELNEDPADRLDAVRFLREWMIEQPHFSYPAEGADTVALLYILRTAKFSQLRARKMLETTAGLFRNPRFKKYLYSLDTHAPDIQAVLDSGLYLPLPKVDKNGRVVLLMRMGRKFKNVTGKVIDPVSEVRGNFAVGNYIAREENIQVNGVSIIVDISGINIKHLAALNNADHQAFNKAMQGNTAGRMKGFHIYNGGAVLEAVMILVKTFMTKKFQERIFVHHTAESLYKALGKDCMPLDYLPDDYKGPNAGYLDTITSDLKKLVTQDHYREFLLRITGDDLMYDESKKPTETVDATFRKLNVD